MWKQRALQAFRRADGGTRTPDPIITSDVLYQLSYVGVVRPRMVATVASAAESRFRRGDAYLKLLADAGLELTRAEDAAPEGEGGQASDALDRAAAKLAELRAGWPAMTPRQRGVVGAAAPPLGG